MEAEVEVLPGRLLLALSPAPPGRLPSRHCFSTDGELLYWSGPALLSRPSHSSRSFYRDFGPLSLGNVVRFCSLLGRKLADPRLADKVSRTHVASALTLRQVLVYFSDPHPHRKANAVFLLAAWSVLCRGTVRVTALSADGPGLSPEQSMLPFQELALPLWHDATAGYCSFRLSLLDTLRGEWLRAV